MKRNTPEHPKMFALEEALKLPRYAVVGIMEMLWHYTAKFAPEGDIGKYPDAAIAKACHWNRSPEQLVSALVRSGWLDESETHRLIVHDWADHADDYTKKRLKKADRTFVKSPELSGKSLESSGQSLENYGLPVPVPVPVPKPMPVARPTFAGQRGVVGQELLAEFAKVRRLMESVGIVGSDMDWNIASGIWRAKDPDQKADLDKALMRPQPDWVRKTLPQNYIESKYERIMAAAEAPKPKSAIEARAENW